MIVASNTFDAAYVKAYAKLLFGAFLLLVYVWLFTYFYIENIYPRWGYFGFRLGLDNADSYWVGVACIFLAYFFIPRRASAASDYVLWLLFVLAFVPIQVTVGLSNSLLGGVFFYQVSLLISFAISALIAKIAGRIVWISPRKLAPSRSGNARMHQGRFKKYFVIASLFVVAVLVIRFHSIMNFSGVEEIYEQRSAASEFGIGIIFGYLILWTTYLLSPLIIAIALVTKSRMLLVAAAVMLLIIYMITASKVIFVIIAFCSSIHVFNRFALKEHMYLLFVIPVAPMIVASLFNFSSDGDKISLASIIIDQIIIRGVAIQAMIFNLYIEYFSNNPFTYYSHITGVSALINYPYDLPVGRVISVYQYGNPDVNANSGLWATDGVAAAGPVGILIIGVLLGAFLAFTNRLTKDVGHEFLSIAMVPLAMLMVNASMFTTLASGGGLLLVLLVRRLWRDIDTKNTEPRHTSQIKKL